MKSHIKFLTWFIEQHGERPIPPGRDKAMLEIVEQGETAAQLLRASKFWDAQKESALYAWTAGPGQKKGA